MEKAEYFVYCGFFIRHLWGERFATRPKGSFLELLESNRLRHPERCRSRFSALHHHSHNTQERGAMLCRSSDSCLRVLSQLFPPSQEKLSVTGFRHGNNIGTYSGGTVRDFHPIILFSNTGSSPALPQSKYEVTITIACPEMSVKGRIFSLTEAVFLCYNIKLKKYGIIHWRIKL